MREMPRLAALLVEMGRRSTSVGGARRSSLIGPVGADVARSRALAPPLARGLRGHAGKTGAQPQGGSAAAKAKEHGPVKGPAVEEVSTPVESYDRGSTPPWRGLTHHRTAECTKDAAEVQQLADMAEACSYNAVDGSPQALMPHPPSAAEVERRAEAKAKATVTDLELDYDRFGPAQGVREAVRTKRSVVEEAVVETDFVEEEMDRSGQHPKEGGSKAGGGKGRA